MSAGRIDKLFWLRSDTSILGDLRGKIESEAGILPIYNALSFVLYI